MSTSVKSLVGVFFPVGRNPKDYSFSKEKVTEFKITGNFDSINSVKIFLEKKTNLFNGSQIGYKTNAYMRNDHKVVDVFFYQNSNGRMLLKNHLCNAWKVYPNLLCGPIYVLRMNNLNAENFKCESFTKSDYHQRCTDVLYKKFRYLLNKIEKRPRRQHRDEEEYDDESEGEN